MNETVQKRMEEVRRGIKEENLEHIKDELHNDVNELNGIINNPDYEQALKASIDRACDHDIFNGESRNAVLNEMSQIGIDVNNVLDIDYNAANIIKLVRNGDISQNDASMLYGDNMSIERRLCCIDLANALAKKRTEGEYHDIGYFRDLIDPKYTNEEIYDFTKAVQEGRDPMVAAALHEVYKLNDVFGMSQMESLSTFLHTDISLRKFMVCADPELSPGSIDHLRKACLDGLGVKTIEALAECCKYDQKHDLRFDNVDFLRNELKEMNGEQRMKANKYISSQFNENQLAAIMSCVTLKNITPQYIDEVASPDRSPNVMFAMVQGFALPGIDKDKIVTLANSEGNPTEVVSKINEYVLNHEVKYYKEEVKRLEDKLSKLDPGPNKRTRGTWEEEEKARAAKADEIQACEKSLSFANDKLSEARLELQELTGKIAFKTKVEDKKPAVEESKAKVQAKVQAQVQDKNKSKPDDPDGRD